MLDSFKPDKEWKFSSFVEKLTKVRIVIKIENFKLWTASPVVPVRKKFTVLSVIPTIEIPIKNIAK